MNELNFVDRVKKYFGYLESEYSFKPTVASNSDMRPKTDGAVEYTSDTTVVMIDSETGQAAVRFWRIKDGKEYYITPVDIFEYLNSDDEEKQLLLSINPQDRTAASNLFNKKFLLNQPGWKSESLTTQGELEIRLANYASWLKAHADLCLKGNFSQWPAFYEYKIMRMRADHLRHGRDELGYVRIRDNEGKYKLVKQSIFKEDFEHIEKLKKEFSR